MPKRQQPTPDELNAPLQGHKTVVVVSDLHVSSSVGLWPKNQAIQDGGIAQQNKFQQYLWKCWEDFLKHVAKMDRPILVLNGDVIQGVNGNRDGQLVTSLASIQAEAAEKVLQPLVEMCSKVYFVRGSEFHEGRVSEHVERLAATLGSVKAPDGSNAWWELYLDLGGKVIHFAHHISVSGIPWGQATAPTRDALILLMELARRYGSKAPNLRMMVRSHRHQYVQVHLPPDLTSLTTPAWQLRGAYVYKKSPSSLAQIGYVVIEDLGDRLIATPHLYPLPLPHVERTEEA